LQESQEHPFQSQEFEGLGKKLEFCQFSDYIKIIRPNWLLFKDAFGNVDILSKQHQEVTDARNALKHSREISRSKLASAEAGLLWFEDCLRAVRSVEEEVEENGMEEENEAIRE
jgi:hypothetical protein